MALKRIVLLLIILSLVLPLAGCGASPSPDTDTSDTPEEASETSASPAPEPYNIVWYTGCFGSPQEDTGLVCDALSYYLLKNYDMNVSLTIVETPYGDLSAAMANVVESGEKWDLCFTSSWANSFSANLRKGAFLALDEYLDTDAPALKELIGTRWAASSADGHIYAVPNLQYTCSYPYIALPTQWVSLYNEVHTDAPLDPDTIKTPTELGGFFSWAKDNLIDTGVTLNGTVPRYAFWGDLSSLAAAYGMESTGCAGTYFQIGDETCTVKTMFDFPDYMEALRTEQTWYDEGLIAFDIADTDPLASDLDSLWWMSYCGCAYSPEEVERQYRNWGLDASEGELTFFPFGEPYRTAAGVTYSMTAVNADCADPHTVVKFLSILNTDETACQILFHGIKGYHYTLTDGCAVPSQEHTGYNPENDWGLGNTYLALPRAGEAVTVHRNTQTLDMTATDSCAMGFRVDTTEIAGQLSDVEWVIAQYDSYVSSGALFGTAEDWDAYMEQYQADLYEAGLQDIMDEVQSQVDAWLKTGS